MHRAARVKLLFTNGTRDWGGEKSWALETARCLERRGHACAMLGRAGDPWIDACRDAGLATRGVQFGRVIFHPTGVASVYRIARALRPDCIVVNISYDMCAGAAVGALLDIPVVRHVGLAEDLNHDPVDWLLHTRCLRGTIAVGHQMKREMLEHYRWLEAAHIEVIHIGKDTQLFHTERCDDLRGELGLRKDALLVGVTSQLEAKKGHAVLFEALARLGGDQLHLAVVGRGSHRNELERKARALDLADRIHFLGFRRDVPRLLRCFDVFALPSFSEGFPNSLVEAMATGLPCISTNVACVSEIVDHDRNGLLVQAGDAERLASALARLLDDAALRRSLGDEARATVEARFSLEATTDRCESYLTGIVDAHRSRH